MSFKREGDDLSELNILKKRRVEELLSKDIPDDEAHLMKNGRFACLVCSHQPVLDTIEMLCIHRDGKRHKQCAEHFFRKKREFHQLVEKRRQEQSLHGNSANNAKAPLLMRTQTACQNALLRYAPYNPISSGAQSGQNTATEDFKTKRSKTKGFFEYTRNYLTNNVPARCGRPTTNTASQSRQVPASSMPDNLHQSLQTSIQVLASPDRTASPSSISEASVLKPYISKKRRKDQATGTIQDKQTSGIAFSVKQAARHADNRSHTDIKEQDEKWESISQFPPLREGGKLESKTKGSVYTKGSTNQTLEKSHSRLHRDNVSPRTEGTAFRSMTDGSFHAEECNNQSTALQKHCKRFHDGRSCHGTEGSKHVRQRLQNDMNSIQFSSLERVTLVRKHDLQKNSKSYQHERTSLEIKNSETDVEQNRETAENKPCPIKGSALEHDESILQQGDLNNQSISAHQSEVRSVENSLTAENLYSEKSKLSESIEIKKKNQQPVKFTIGMSTKERICMNQRLSSEGVCSPESVSKVNTSNKGNFKEKRKANPVIKQPSKYSEQRKKELQRHLELTSSGWVCDPSGKWVKNEDVEFDSDEEEPM